MAVKVRSAMENTIDKQRVQGLVRSLIRDFIVDADFFGFKIIVEFTGDSLMELLKYFNGSLMVL